MCLAERLKELREEKKLSQTNLADLLGVTKMTISRYENSTREPNNKMLQKISSVLDVSVSYLLGETEIPLSKTQQSLIDEIYNNIDDVINEHHITINGQKATKTDIIRSLSLIKDILVEIEKKKVGNNNSQ